MSKLLSALADLFSGVFIVLAAFAGARVLLQNPLLARLFFPLLIAASLAVGFWRGRSSTLAWPVVALLATIPLLILVLAFFSGRNKPFIALPLVAFPFVAAAIVSARSRPRFAAVAAVLIAISAGAFAGPRFVRLLVASQDVREAPVPFEIRLVDGSTISSASLRGKVVVLDFWATWCVPCRHELPAIQRVHDRLKGQHDVAIVAIDGVMTDSPGDAGDTAAKAAAFFRQNGFTIPLAFDGGAVLEKKFGLAGFPTLLVLDREGRVRMRHVGFIGAEDLEATLLAKIAELRTERFPQFERITYGAVTSVIALHARGPAPRASRRSRGRARLRCSPGRSRKGAARGGAR